jgi:hypothetical protein
MVNELSQNYEEGGLARTCQLIFEGGLTTSSNDMMNSNPPNHPTIGMAYGGRSSDPTGHDIANPQPDTGSIVKENLVTKNIQARLYAVTKPYLRISLGVTVDANVWQMNTHKTHLPDLVRAKEAILYTELAEKRVRVRLIRPPAVYGLGEGYQCMSFWQEI